MEKFKPEDICEIVDIGEGDVYFPQKDKLIGKKVEYRWYSTFSNYREQNGFSPCMVYVCDEYENFEKTIRSTLCFQYVKLKKVV